VRRKLQRLPHVQITPEIAWAFQQLKKLETQCSCSNNRDECKACSAWWTQQTVIHHALKLPPHFWPCLPDPFGPVSPGARALYEQLDAALTGT
jgi:hypothetical protein